eukprot:289679_1
MANLWKIYSTLITYVFTVSNAMSFGIHLPIKNHAQTVDTITSTLIWNGNVVTQCNLFPYAQDSWFMCDDVSVNYIHCRNFNVDILSNLDASTTPYMIHFDHLGDDAVWIDEIKVIDDDGIEYLFNVFCSSLSFTQAWETQPTGNCNNYAVQEWTYMCMDGDADCNSYNTVDIILSPTTNEALVTLSSISQPQILFCPKNTYLSFGIYVPVKTNAQTSHTVKATLNWNGNVVQCNLHPIAQDLWYLCDISAADYMQCNNYDISASYPYMIQLEIPSTSTNGLWVDSIKIIDNWNDNVFIYTTFCSSLTFLSAWETQPTNNCNDFGVKEWTFFCMDGDDSCNSYYIIDIILSYPPFNDEALIQSSANAFPTILCSFDPTKTPTWEPTISPTKNPTISPTKSPTNNPSKTPSFSPTKTPTISPSFSPTIETIAPSISTEMPSLSPTQITTTPTFVPTKLPTLLPTTSPTFYPSIAPTRNEQEQKDIITSHVEYVVTNDSDNLSQVANQSYIMYLIIALGVTALLCFCCVVAAVIYCRKHKTKSIEDNKQETNVAESTQKSTEIGELVKVQSQSKIETKTINTPSGNENTQDGDNDSETGEDDDLYGANLYGSTTKGVSAETMK